MKKGMIIMSMWAPVCKYVDLSQKKDRGDKMSKLNFKNDHYDNENEKYSIRDSLSSIQVSPDDETNIKKWDEATLNELVYRIATQGVTLPDILKIVDDMKKEKLKYKDLTLRG